MQRFSVSDKNPVHRVHGVARRAAPVGEQRFPKFGHQVEWASALADDAARGAPLQTKCGSCQLSRPGWRFLLPIHDRVGRVVVILFQIHLLFYAELDSLISISLRAVAV